MDKIIERSRLNKATRFSAETFSNAILVNEGGLRFTMKSLPVEAQFSSYHDALVEDLDGDGTQDIWLVGNFDGDVLALGRNDADQGSWLLNRGSGKLAYVQAPAVRGVAKKIRPLRTEAGTLGYIIARNNAPVVLLRKQVSTPDR
jgi:hypothetical protein